MVHTTNLVCNVQVRSKSAMVLPSLIASNCACTEVRGCVHYKFWPRDVILVLQYVHCTDSGMLGSMVSLLEHNGVHCDYYTVNQTFFFLFHALDFQVTWLKILQNLILM